jgi:chaperone required for assembly of F1-ATPase
MTAPSESAAVRPDWTPEPLPAGGWGLIWRGRRMKTPERRAVALPTRALAALVAEPAPTAISPAQRLAFTAIDRVADAREAVGGQVASYGASDALCYMADKPEALFELQRERWAPWLGWAQAELGVALDWTRGIAHTAQPPASLERIKGLALELDDFCLTGLAAAAPLYGSAVLAFAVERARLSGEAAFELSRLDEAFQAERWGLDPEAGARNAALEEEAGLLDRWFKACKSA